MAESWTRYSPTADRRSTVTIRTVNTRNQFRGHVVAIHRGDAVSGVEIDQDILEIPCALQSQRRSYKPTGLLFA